MMLLNRTRKYVNNYLIIIIIYISILIELADAQQGSIVVTFDVVDSTGAVNPYFLILLFWLIVLFWPVGRWLYSTFIERAVNRVKERVESIAHQLSERISAAGRKLSESVKVDKV